MDKKKEENTLLHEFTASSDTSILSKKLLVALLVVAFLGIGTGYLLSGIKGKSSKIGGGNKTGGFSLTGKKVVGSDDMKTYRDTAEGVLKEGGIEGEGQFHLVRPGGDSQNVYLTSSIVDLSEFLDKKIKVFGETQKAQKAGWLMDVGRVEVQ